MFTPTTEADGPDIVTQSFPKTMTSSSIPDPALRERWESLAQPASEQTTAQFNRFLAGPNGSRRILQCAIPIARAHQFARASLPPGVTTADCLQAAGTGRFPEALRGWNYEPMVRSLPQLPQMRKLPAAHAQLRGLPWFDSPGQSAWLGLNARHLRYHHDLWQTLRPRVLQGVQTTLVLAMPQTGFCLTPHVQMEKVFLYLGSLARGLMPAQLFPARYLYPAQGKCFQEGKSLNFTA